MVDSPIRTLLLAKQAKPPARPADAEAPVYCCHANLQLGLVLDAEAPDGVSWADLPAGVAIFFAGTMQRNQYRSA